MSKPANPTLAVPSADDLAAAAEWLVLINSGSATDRERHDFNSWLNQAPGHMAACRSLEHSLGQLQSPRQIIGPEVRQVLLDAHGRRKFLRRGLGAFLVGGTAAGLALQRNPPSQWGADIATGIAEPQQVVLDNGTLHLDARSAVDQDGIGITLRAGAVVFDCVHSGCFIESRGFRLVAQGPARLHACARSDGSVRLGVLKAEAELHAQGGWVAGIDASQIVEVAADAPPRVQRQSVDPLAWLDGMIELRNDTVGELVYQARRYDRGLIVATPAAAELRLSGRLPLSRIDDLFAALAGTLPVDVRRVSNWLTVISQA